MNWGGAFVARTKLGPSRFTGFNGYPQPTLAAFSSVDPNLTPTAPTAARWTYTLGLKAAAYSVSV
jgi:hypothetical protein